MKNKTFKIGIIGTGRIARVHYLALRMLPNVEVKAVASRTPENAQKFCDTFQIPICCSSIEELCDISDIDAIHICNTNTAHIEAIRSSIGSGKAMLCEKPLAQNLETINEIFQLTRQHNVPFSICYSYRYHPTALLLMQHLPEIGTIRQVEISYLQSSWLKKVKNGWKPDPAIYGDSYVLADIGSHAIDMVQYLLQKSLDFKEATVQYHGEIRKCSDIAATVKFTTKDNVQVIIKVSKMEEDVTNRFQIHFIGDDGELGTEHLLSERIYLIKRGDKRWINRGVDVDGDVLKFPEEHTEGWMSGFINLFNVFYRHLSGMPINLPLPTVKESVQIANLTEQIMQKGHWKEIW